MQYTDNEENIKIDTKNACRENLIKNNSNLHTDDEIVLTSRHSCSISNLYEQTTTPSHKDWQDNSNLTQYRSAPKRVTCMHYTSYNSVGESCNAHEGGGCWDVYGYHDCDEFAEDANKIQEKGRGDIRWWFDPIIGNLSSWTTFNEHHYILTQANRMIRKAITHANPIPYVWHLSKGVMNKVNHARNGNIPIDLIVTILANLMAENFMYAVSTGIAVGSTKVYLTDSNRLYRTRKTVQETSMIYYGKGRTANGGKDHSIYFPSTLIRTHGIDSMFYEKMKILSKDRFGYYIDLTNGQEFSFAIYTKDKTPAVLREQYLRQKKDLNVSRLMRDIGAEVMSRARLLSEKFVSRVYITDSNDEFGRSEEYLTGTSGVTYKHQNGYIMAPSVFSWSTKDSNDIKYICEGLFEDGAECVGKDELSYTAIDLYRDNVGWYYCPGTYLNQTARIHEAIQGVDVDKSDSDTFVATVKIEKTGNEEEFNEGKFVHEFTPSTTTTEPPITNMPVYRPTTIPISEPTTGIAEEATESTTLSTVTELVNKIKTTVLELDVVTTTRGPVTSQAPALTTHWIGAALSGVYRQRQMPKVINSTVEDYIRDLSKRTTSLCLRLTSLADDLLIRRVRSMPNEMFFDGIRACKEALGEGGDIDQNIIDNLNIIDGYTMFYEKHGTIYAQIPHIRHSHGDGMVNVMNVMFRDILRSILFAAQANQKTHHHRSHDFWRPSRFYRNKRESIEMTTLQTSAQIANSLFNRRARWVSFSIDGEVTHLTNVPALTGDSQTDNKIIGEAIEQVSRNSGVYLINARYEDYANLYDALTCSLWYDTRYSKYVMLGEHFNLYEIESELHNLYPGLGYKEIFHNMMSVPYSTFLYNLIRTRQINTNAIGLRDVTNAGEYVHALDSLDESTCEQHFFEIRSSAKNVPICVVVKPKDEKFFAHRIHHYTGMHPRMANTPRTWMTYSPLVITKNPKIVRMCKFSIVHHMSREEFEDAKRSSLISGEYHVYYHEASRANVIMITDRNEDTILALRLYKDVIDKQYHGILSLT